MTTTILEAYGADDGAAATTKPERTPPLDFRNSKARALRVAIYRRDLFTCQLCGWMPDHVPYDYDGRLSIGWWHGGAERALHVDHIVPRRDGGPNTLDNLQTLCEPCNLSKGARPMAVAG